MPNSSAFSWNNENSSYGMRSTSAMPRTLLFTGCATTKRPRRPDRSPGQKRADVTANRLRDVASRETAFGAWCTIPSGAVAEQLALTDPDYVCIDCQHGLIDYADMVAMLHGMARTGVTSVVRVVGHDHAAIGKVLDAGADAVIVPMVNDGAEAEYVASACRYAPAGVRSYGPG